MDPKLRDDLDKFARMWWGQELDMPDLDPRFVEFFSQYLQDLLGTALAQRLPPGERDIVGGIDIGQTESATAGTYDPSTSRIGINLPLLSRHPDAIPYIVSHEVGHAIDYADKVPQTSIPSEVWEKLLSDLSVPPSWRALAYVGAQYPGEAIAHILATTTSLSNLPDYLQPYFKGLLRYG